MARYYEFRIDEGQAKTVTIYNPLPSGSKVGKFYSYRKEIPGVVSFSGQNVILTFTSGHAVPANFPCTFSVYVSVNGEPSYKEITGKASFNPTETAGPEEETFVSSDTITTVEKVTQAQYNALTPNANTLYIVVG